MIESPQAVANGTSAVAQIVNGVRALELREWLLLLILCGLIISNLVFALRLSDSNQRLEGVYRSYMVEQDLNKYNLDFFKQNDWVNLKTDLEVTKQLIALRCGK